MKSVLTIQQILDDNTRIETITDKETLKNILTKVIGVTSYTKVGREKIIEVVEEIYQEFKIKWQRGKVMSEEEHKSAEESTVMEDNKSKSEDIGIETDSDMEGASVVDENDMKYDVMKIFEDADYAYPLEDVIEELRKFGYVNPGSVILSSLQREILYIDSIEDDGTVFLAVTEED